MMKFENEKGMTRIVLILIIIGALLLGCISIGLFINKKEEKENNAQANMFDQQNIKEESSNNNNVSGKTEISICDEYYDITNPIPVKKDNKYGYINNKGNLIINYQYQKGYDFNGQYAIVQDIDNSYYLIDRSGKKVMDVPSELNTYSNKYEMQLDLDLVKYGVYFFYSNKEAYDINLKKIEYSDRQMYSDVEDKNYNNDFSSLSYNELLSRYNYSIDGNSVLYNNEKVMDLDYGDTIDLPEYDELNYYINKKNILPVIISGSGKTQIIDLISRSEIATADISKSHRGYFTLYGKFAEFSAPMMSGISKIYSFYNNKFIEVDPNFGDSTFGKTYYVLENGGNIGKESTKYIYYNSDGEKIYETSEKVVMY